MEKEQTSKPSDFGATEYEARKARRVKPEQQTLGATFSYKRLEISISFSGGVQLQKSLQRVHFGATEHNAREARRVEPEM